LKSKLLVLFGDLAITGFSFSDMVLYWEASVYPDLPAKPFHDIIAVAKQAVPKD
jgi:hypothetical protein